MATAAEYHTIGHLFGVAHCMACVIVHNTINAIVDVFYFVCTLGFLVVTLLQMLLKILRKNETYSNVSVLLMRVT